MTHQINTNCRTDGSACTRLGARQAQSLGIRSVPNVSQAAIIDPKYQVADIVSFAPLKSESILTVVDSCISSSMLRVDELSHQKGGRALRDGDSDANDEPRGNEHLYIYTQCSEKYSPNPVAFQSMQILRLTSSYIMNAPMMIPIRRPSLSAMYGVTVRATIEPTCMMQLRRPNEELFG